ncbi:MAG: T9SS type A sorting domain-containing protein [Bacteroidetes bacterium]|nr:T9SS type A sorting domain-containing protein [Bacteroidota bacterium]
MKKLLLSVILVMFMTGITCSQDLLWSQSENVNDLFVGDFVETDDSNNVYVGARGTGKMYVIKYDQAGIMQFISGDDNTSSFTGMVVNNEGRSFLAGSSYQGASKDDGLIHVYEPDGTEHYTQYYNFIDEPDNFRDIFVDENNYAYVTGEANDVIDRYALTIKYSPSGALQWVQRYGSILVPYMGMKVNVNSSGEAFVTGVFSNTTLQTIDLFIIKYDANGNLLSEFETNFAGYDECVPVFTLLDDNDNLFVGGILSNTAPDFAGFLIRVTDGNLVWTQIFTSPNDYIILYDGTLDAGGNVIIAGLYKDGVIDAYYAKISPTGGLLYEKTYNGTGDGNDAFTKLITKDEYTYLCGTGGGIGTMSDYLILKVNANGEKIWEAHYNGFGNGEDVAYDIELDNEDNVIVTGSSVEQSGQYCTTLKFSNSLGIYDPEGIGSHALEVFPNPAGEQARLKYNVESADAYYNIIGVSGKLVKTSKLSKAAAHELGLENIPAGIYFIQIRDGLKHYYAKFVRK